MMRSEVEDRRKKPSVRTRLTVARRGTTRKRKTGMTTILIGVTSKEEFKKIWDAQSKHHSDILTDDVHQRFSRPSSISGLLRNRRLACVFSPGFTGSPQVRGACRRHTPLFQRRVLFETVNNLKVIADGKPRRFLTMEERDTIIPCAR